MFHPVVFEGSPPHPGLSSYELSDETRPRRGKIRALAKQLGKGSFSTVQAGFFQVDKLPAFSVAVKKILLMEEDQPVERVKEHWVASALRSVLRLRNRNSSEDLEPEKEEPQGDEIEKTERSRIVSERQALVALQSCEYIVRYFGYTNAPGSVWLLSEACIEISLLKLLSDVGKERLGVSFYIICPIIDALAFMHKKGMIHRDVKPENILLSREGVPRLCDFGITFDTKTEALQPFGEFGTRPFMAPEIILGNYYGPKVDCWSVGLTMANLWRGKEFRVHTAWESSEIHIFQAWNTADVIEKATLEGNLFHFLSRPLTIRSPKEAMRLCESLLLKTLVFTSDLRASGDELLRMDEVSQCLAFWKGETDGIPEGRKKIFQASCQVLKDLVEAVIDKELGIPSF